MNLNNWKECIEIIFQKNIGLYDIVLILGQIHILLTLLLCLYFTGLLSHELSYHISIVINFDYSHFHFAFLFKIWNRCVSFSSEEISKNRKYCIFLSCVPEARATWHVTKDTNWSKDMTWLKKPDVIK